MAFRLPDKKGTVYAPGWFLAHEECERKTRQISASGVAADADGGKHVPMGTIWPSNDGNAVGILYEDVDVTDGDMPGSVVLSGVVYKDRLAETLDASAETALVALGFKFIDTAPAVVRP